MVLSLFVRIVCIIKLLFYKIFKRKCIHFGKKSRFKNGCKFYADKNSCLTIGNSTFFNRYCSVISRGKISIGDDCLFGENVKIYDHNHIFNRSNSNINELGLNIGEISIGNNCWIGSNVVITKGTKIGDNCVISAGLVIGGIIEPNTIVTLDKSMIKKESIIYK